MKSATVVAGLGFGDEGKGMTTAFLTRQHAAKMVARYNGGANAAHNVTSDDFRHHTFRQFGSGTFEGASTYLGRHVCFDPIEAWAEYKRLRLLGENPALIVHPQALVVTEYHKYTSLINASIHKRGTTANGVGTTKRWAETHPDMALRVCDLINDPQRVYEKLQYLEARICPVESFYREIGDDLIDALNNVVTAVSDESVLGGFDHVIFEGAQGALLDCDRGYRPYVTSSDTTFSGALEMIPSGTQVKRVGVTRIYATRHGVGPFPSESHMLDRKAIVERHNHDGLPELQGAWRVGWLDRKLLRYAADNILGGIHEIALSHVDRFNPEQLWNVIDLRGTDRIGMKDYIEVHSLKSLVELIEVAAFAPVKIMGHGRRVCEWSRT